MKVFVLGAGVIGTTYAYALKKAGHEVLHLVRDRVKDQFPRKINVNILDGRGSQKGQEYSDIYEVKLAKPNR